MNHINYQIYLYVKLGRKTHDAHFNFIPETWKTIVFNAMCYPRKPREFSICKLLMFPKEDR
jgi:hypothetical protein